MWQTLYDTGQGVLIGVFATLLYLRRHYKISQKQPYTARCVFDGCNFNVGSSSEDILDDIMIDHNLTFHKEYIP